MSLWDWNITCIKQTTENKTKAIIPNSALYNWRKIICPLPSIEGTSLEIALFIALRTEKLGREGTAAIERRNVKAEKFYFTPCQGPIFGQHLSGFSLDRIHTSLSRGVRIRNIRQEEQRYKRKGTGAQNRT